MLNCSVSGHMSQLLDAGHNQQFSTFIFLKNKPLHMPPVNPRNSQNYQSEKMACMRIGPRYNVHCASIITVDGREIGYYGVILSNIWVYT